MSYKIKNINSKIRKSKDARTLVANFGYLILLQVAGYIFPLITLPYLARVIGVDGFGKIAFASATIIWFQTIADWGFTFTATRDVAKNRDNKEIVSRIFSNVLWARLLLTILSFILLLVCILCIPKFYESADIILITFLLIPGHIMFPDWFFQAMERMKYITWFNLFCKFFFTVAIFLFIKDSGDYILQPLFTTLGYVFSGIIAMYIILYRWGIKLQFTSAREVLGTIKTSTNVFINNIFPNLYNAFSMVLLGFFGGAAANGIFDAGAKFENIAYNFIQTISRVFFPFLSRRIDKHHIFVRLNLTIAITIFLVLFFGAPLIIKLFFTTEFHTAIPVLQIISFSIIFLTLSNAYGTNYMIITGHERELRNITMVCSVCGFLMSFPLIYYFNYIGAAITITTTRGMLGISEMIYVKKLQRNN